MANVLGMPTPENFYRGVGPAAPAPAVDYGTHNVGGGGPHGYGGYGGGVRQPEGVRNAKPVGTGMRGGKQRQRQAFSAESVETVPVVDEGTSVPITKSGWPWYVWAGIGIGVAVAAPPLVRYGLKFAKQKMG